VGEYVALDKIFYNTRSKPLAYVFKREQDDNPVPSNRAVAMFLLTTTERLTLGLSAYTVSLLLCE